jgi:hypothetical protein
MGGTAAGASRASVDPTVLVARSLLRARSALVLAPEWRAARLWTSALVVALFPFLFIVDRVVATRLSPVLPGLAVLLLAILVLPFALMEVSLWRFRRKERDLGWQSRKAARSVHNARTALVIALVWLGLWFAVGT